MLEGRIPCPVNAVEVRTRPAKIRADVPPSSLFIEITMRDIAKDDMVIVTSCKFTAEYPNVYEVRK